MKVEDKAEDMGEEERDVSQTMVIHDRDQGNDDNIHHRGQVKSLTKTRGLLLLSNVMLTIGLVDVAGSLKAPFYTALAKSKDIPSAGYGLTMSATHVTVLLVSPIVGNKVHLYGPKKILILGLILEGLASVGLGSVEMILNHTIFLVVSFVSQTIEGFGQTMIFVSCFAAGVSFFSHRSSGIISKIEFAGGIGMVTGPVVGSILISQTNFMITCLILAATILIMVPLTNYSMPAMKCKDARTPNDKYKIVQILKIRKMWIPIVILVASTINAGFSSVALEPHLEQFHLTNLHIGLIFSMSTLTYTLFVLAYGKLCSKGVSEFLCMLSGLVLQIIGMGMVGPLPWIPVDSSLPVSLTGIILGAAGNAGTVIPSCIFMQKLPPAASFAAEVDVNSLVSAIFQSALSFGSIVGTVVGGVIFSCLPFRESQFIFWVLFVLLLLAFIYLKCFHEDLFSSTSKNIGLDNSLKSECLYQEPSKSSECMSGP